MQGDAEDDSKASLMDGSYWKNQNRLVVNLGANRKHMVIRKVKSVYLACFKEKHRWSVLPRNALRFPTESSFLLEMAAALASRRATHNQKKV
jgi:hypothetical protein